MHRITSNRRTALAGAALALLAAFVAVAAADTLHGRPHPPLRGSVMLEPGYYPANDPESSSVRIGRRVHAPLVAKRFQGGARSLDELGRMVCHALDYPYADTLFSLTVHEDEFRDILWPEFPQSRPATGITWRDGWLFTYGGLHKGCGQAIRDHGGHWYQFIRFDRTDSTAHYKNFNLVNGLVLVAKDDQGQVQRFEWLRSAVERKGRYKLYSVKV
jgi:hypothetical protein